jgi:hypothetical protein
MGKTPAILSDALKKSGLGMEILNPELVLAAEIYQALKDGATINFAQLAPEKNKDISSGIAIVFKAATTLFQKDKTPLYKDEGIVKKFMAAYEAARQPELKMGVVVRKFCNAPIEGMPKTFVNVLMEGQKICFELAAPEKNVINVGDVIFASDVKKIKNEKRLCTASSIGTVLPKDVKDFLDMAEPNYHINDIENGDHGSILYGRVESINENLNHIVIKDRADNDCFIKLTTPVRDFDLSIGDSFIALPKRLADGHYSIDPKKTLKLKDPFSTYAVALAPNHIIGSLWFKDSPPEGEHVCIPT